MPDYGVLTAEDAVTAEDDVKERIRLELARLQSLLEKNYQAVSVLAPSSVPRASKPDFSIYTGAGGNAYMYWKLSEHYARHFNKSESKRCLQLAVAAIETALSLIGQMAKLHVNSYIGVSFYIGDAGIYALASVIYHRSGHVNKCQHCVQQLLSESSRASKVDEDEILYGRAGYLFCLLFVKKHLPAHLVPIEKLESTATSVAEVVIETGVKGSRGQKHLRINLLIKESLDYLLNVQLPSGNFPAAADDDPSRADCLVHWCHGAPGFVSLFTKANECYGDVKYKEAALAAARCVWHRGLLRKGIPLCHGISGNAYAFFNLYRATKDLEHKYRALKFCEALCDPAVQKQLTEYDDRSRHVKGVPDTPYSLLEGYAGVVCLFVDALSPEQSAFPGYDGDM
ncbi:glutathione S-transferase LANCL1-like isoform X3 [Corticium candelabrum]|uniref:glutathione S-transferase LANCL1-like isoform X3 n=1 Tax=Corticium candelabrum TaxID=121492 RepID=UPI002E276EB7|nr:glutathione S-transferase LANCL1-like isoform X3 [Corticium candelabrum]